VQLPGAFHVVPFPFWSADIPMFILWAARPFFFSHACTFWMQAGARAQRERGCSDGSGRHQGQEAVTAMCKPLNDQ
jgi:hypothetical protein